MFDKAQSLLSDASKIIVIQGENPDGDSLGSALALEEIVSDLGKEVSLYCHIDMPKYLHYIKGWDRVTNEFDANCDLAVIVDTSSDALLNKALETPGVRHFMETHPVLVIDHHTSESTLAFEHTLLSEDVVAATHVIYDLAIAAGWSINPQAAENLMSGLMSDSLGLTTQTVTADTFDVAAALTRLGAKNSEIENRRREYMRKSAEILKYKGELIGRIEYLAGGALALVHIPWEDIQAYSDQYNPSVLVLDEMRLVEHVEVAIAIKTYPDGKLTGKIRCNQPVAHLIAGFFGGGGHEYSAGFKVYEDYDTVLREVVEATHKALRDVKEQG